jgi:hypothetical protein
MNNSISDIQDELEIIKNKNKIKKENITNKNCNNKNSLENIEKYINNKTVNMFARKWTQLEYKLKKQKILEYLDTLLKNKKINEDEYKTSIKNYYNEINLNRKLKVKYDSELCHIISIN